MQFLHSSSIRWLAWVVPFSFSFQWTNQHHHHRRSFQHHNNCCHRVHWQYDGWQYEMNFVRFLKHNLVENTIEKVGFNKTTCISIIPMHFSRCGANRDEATARSQLGQTQSIAFFVLVAPKTSLSGKSINVNLCTTENNNIHNCNYELEITKKLKFRQIDTYTVASSGSPSSATSKPVLW